VAKQRLDETQVAGLVVDFGGSAASFSNTMAVDLLTA
jgi:hypothetical protein